MARLSIALALLVAANLTTSAEPTELSDQILQVGVYGYHGDGSQSGSAYETEPSLASLVYVGGSLCQMGAGNHRQPPEIASDAWRFSGRVLSKSAAEATIQLDWQRVLEDGRAVSTPSGSTQLTLRAGERQLLDSVVPRAHSSCTVTNVGFEARYMPRFSGLGGASSGLVKGGSKSGGGVGAGPGAAPAKPSSAGAGRTSTTGTGTTQPTLYEVNLWLVHSAPAKRDDVLHQVLRTTPQGASFAFAPVAVHTSTGPVMVQITGSFTVAQTSSGDRRLVFMTNRKVTSSPSAEPIRDPIPDAGSSRIVNAFPSPDDVLSFEMPPLSRNGARIAPDQFAIRLRIAN